MRSRLLVAHFLRRFLDNDLISPHTDRHQAIAVTAATLLTSSLFLTVLCSIPYLFRPLQSPGWTVVVSLDDTFLWCGLSMIVMALVALGAWDALALDARDAAILGPLPVPRGTVMAAQLTALVLFALSFAIALNLIPTLCLPLIRVSRLPIGGAALARLIIAHGVTTISAGLLGFAAVLGVRECLRALLGPTLFERASATVQGGFVVLLVASFLVLPVLSGNVERRWLTSAPPPLPPLWFVGLNEALAGDALAGLPRTEPPADAPARLDLLASEARMIGRYRSRATVLADLARQALTAVAFVIALTAAAIAWNGRRVPAMPVGCTTGRRRWQVATGRLLCRTLVRSPLTRGGFFFTIQTLTRSNPHRVLLAIIASGVVTAAAFDLQAIATSQSASLPEPALAAFGTQTLVLFLVVAGFCYMARVPADLRGSVTFSLTQSGSNDRLLAGMKRAGTVALGGPALVLLFPLHVQMLGLRTAAAHAVVGLLLLLLLVEVLVARSPGLPLVSMYQPIGSVLAIAPIYLVAILAMVWIGAGVERVALRSRAATAMLVTLLAFA